MICYLLRYLFLSVSVVSHRNGMKSPYFLVELADANSAVCIPLIIQVIVVLL